jgi:DNA-binding transcriptional MerR regulator
MEKRYYSIGEIASYLKIKPSTIRYWEKEFPALKPARRIKDRRLYSAEDFKLIQKIYYLLKVKGYTIQGAKQILQSEKKRLYLENEFEIVQKLTHLKQFLVNLKNQLESQYHEKKQPQKGNYSEHFSNFDIE